MEPGRNRKMPARRLWVFLSITDLERHFVHSLIYKITLLKRKYNTYTKYKGGMLPGLLPPTVSLLLPTEHHAVSQSSESTPSLQTIRHEEAAFSPAVFQTLESSQPGSVCGMQRWGWWSVSLTYLLNDLLYKYNECIQRAPDTWSVSKVIQLYIWKQCIQYNAIKM